MIVYKLKNISLYINIQSLIFSPYFKKISYFYLIAFMTLQFIQVSNAVYSFRSHL